MTDTTYTDDLALELRLLDVPGVKIGEIFAEIEAHVAETGEDPAEAFGPVSDYARERAGSLPEDQEGGFVARFMRDQWLQMIAGFLYSLLAASLLIGGILDLFIGGPTGPFGLPVWLAIALGVVLSVL